MTNEFDTRELQRHVRQRLARSHREQVARYAIWFFYGVAFGFLLRVLLESTK